MAYFANAASEAGIQTLSGGDPSTDSLLDQDIRMMRNGPSLFVFNYGPVEHQVEVPQGATLVVGGVEGDAARIERSGVNIYKLAA